MTFDESSFVVGKQKSFKTVMWGLTVGTTTGKSTAERDTALSPDTEAAKLAQS